MDNGTALEDEDVLIATTPQEVIAARGEVQVGIALLAVLDGVEKVVEHFF